MIYYGKLLKKLEENGITSYTIKQENLIGQETFKKIKAGTGINEKGYDASKPKIIKDGKERIDKTTRINAIDTKAIEKFCKRLNCQPGELMEYIPNTWENADRLCDILGRAFKYDKKKETWEPLTYEELKEVLDMEE